MNERLSRRNMLAATGAGIAGLALAGYMRPALATPEDMRKAMDDVLAGKPVEMKGVTLDTPIIAENGAQVPLGISVESPMTEADNVKAVHVIAEKNPTPLVATFHFTPQCGVASVKLNVRLAETGKVFALAEMSDGSFRGAEKLVKVTIGGCGGG